MAEQEPIPQLSSAKTCLIVSILILVVASGCGGLTVLVVLGVKFVADKVEEEKEAKEASRKKDLQVQQDRAESEGAANAFLADLRAGRFDENKLDQAYNNTTARFRQSKEFETPEAFKNYIRKYQGRLPAMVAPNSGQQLGNSFVYTIPGPNSLTLRLTKEKDKWLVDNLTGLD